MKYSSQSLLLATLGLTSKTAHAWGSLGHQTVAYLAQHYVSNTTAHWAQAILNDTSSSYLANIATWADSYRYTAEGEFSASFHYIDALDTPPTSCNVDYERDCPPEGCIVSAIANYTRRVSSPAELDPLQVNYALRWIVHFSGDIAQPLHVENYEIGGNGVAVTFDGNETNLHAVWDTYIPEKMRGGYGLDKAKEWAEDLADEITKGEFKDVAKGWLEGIDVNDPVGTSMAWARDGNSYVCSVVMPDGGEVLEGKELYPEYYESATATVQQQVAKAGYRLAAYLDAVADTQASAPSYYRRGVHADMKKRDLSGRDFLPKTQGLSTVQRARLGKRDDLGCGCTH